MRTKAPAAPAARGRVIDLPWGDGTLPVPIPDGWRVLGPYAPAPTRPDADPADLCRQALADPVGARPLAARDLGGRRVLVVCDDFSRPTPVADFFRPVRDELVRADIDRRDIEVLFALGVHRPMTRAEAEAKVGTDNLAGHRWHNHDASDPVGLVRLGTTTRGTPVALNRLLTRFDLVVALGAVEPHPLLGFSGGLKMLLPGCAGVETIGANHLRGACGGRFAYVGADADDSPMRLDLEEGAGLLDREVFVVDAVADHDGRVAGFVCGDGRAAFRAGADLVRWRAAVEVPEPADVAIANSRPFDADLRQGMKCLGNTFSAARPGGLLLGLLRCESGLGDLPPPRRTLPYPLLRGLVRLVGPGRADRIVRSVRRGVPVEDRFLQNFGLRMLHRNHVWVYGGGLPPDAGRRLGAVRQFPDVAGMIAAAAREVGPRAAVAVFPFGGATYVPASPTSDRGASPRHPTSARELRPGHRRRG